MLQKLLNRVLKLNGIKQLPLRPSLKSFDKSSLTYIFYFSAGSWFASLCALIYKTILIFVINPSGYVILLRGLYNYRMYSYSILDYKSYFYFLVVWVLINMVTGILLLKSGKNTAIINFFLTIFLLFINLPIIID